MGGVDREGKSCYCVSIGVLAPVFNSQEQGTLIRNNCMTSVTISPATLLTNFKLVESYIMSADQLLIAEGISMWAIMFHCIKHLRMFFKALYRRLFYIIDFQAE